MAVNLSAPDPAMLLPVKGVRIGIAEAGIRKANRKDLMLMTVSKGTRVAGVFTRNRFCAAPVTVAKAHLQAGSIQALVVNTGCANAGTGEDGLARASRASMSPPCAFSSIRIQSTNGRGPSSAASQMSPLPSCRKSRIAKPSRDASCM